MRYSVLALVSFGAATLGGCSGGSSTLKVRSHPLSGFSVNQLTIPVETSVSFRLTSATVMNSFFVPQLGSQIYTMGAMTTHLNLLASEPGEFPGFSANFSGDGFSRMRFLVKAVPGSDFEAGLRRCGAPGLRSMKPASPSWQSRARPRRRHIAPSRPSCSSASSTRRRRVPQRPLSVRPCHRRYAEMLGKLSWSAIPFSEPLPLISTAVVGIVILVALGIITVKG
jgi:Cytochrome C oxidase subunit II, periplasmic domain